MNENRGMFGYEGEGFDYVNEDEVRRGHPSEGWNIGREDNAEVPTGPRRHDDAGEPVSGTKDATPPEGAGRRGPA